jgi:tetratricopeptide (TPR) repeat protein
VSQAFPDSKDDTNWPLCQQYLPQAQVCADLIERWGIVTYKAGTLLLKMGAYLQERAQYLQAEPLLLSARDILLRTVGEKHSELAQCLETLAILYDKEGDANQAKQLYERALNIWEETLPPEHPLVIHCLTSYTDLLKRDEVKLEQEIQRSSTSDEEQSPLDDFIANCCEFHSRAWCSTSDLWGTYQQWVKKQGERFPLSRRAFADVLRKQGCRADRTNTSRIWRGIALRVRGVEE